MNQHYMKLGWAPGKKRTLGYLDETIAMDSQEVTYVNGTRCTDPQVYITVEVM